MAIVVKDRVKVTTSTTGTGTLTLGSAESGFQAFSVIGDGNQTYYAIKSDAGFEVGIGTYTNSGTTLSRDTILESSNSGSAVSLTGTSTVFTTYPAERSSFRNVGVARDYTASGSITAGKPLILNADNTVSQVATTTSSDVVISNTTGTGLTDSFSSERQAFNFYCSAQNTFVAGYLNASQRPSIVAYTVATDGTVSFGTPVVLKSIGSYTIDGILISGSTVVFTYGDNSGSTTYGYIRAGTLSGTTFTLGTEVEVSSAGNYYNYMYCSLGYDSNADAGLVTYSYNSTSTVASASIKSKVFTLSGTTITLGSETAIDSTTGKFGNLAWGYYGVGSCLNTVFDPDNNLIVAIRSYPTGQGTESVDAYVGTITGGSTRSVSWGSKQTIKANTSGSDGSSQPKYIKQISSIYDTINNRLLIGHIDDNGSNQPANWKTDISNCTINSNSTITVNSSTEVASYRSYPSFAFINENNSYIFVLSAAEYYDNTAYDTFYKVVPSSTAVTVSTLHTSNFYSKYTGGIAYNSTDKTTGYLTYYFANSTSFTYDLVVRSGGFSTSANLTNDNYFGIASSSASDTEAVGVNRPGSINIDQTGLTSGKDYYAKDDGTIVERTTTTNTTNDSPTVAFTTMNDADTVSSDGEAQIVYDSTSETFVVSYENPSNSDYPTVVAGTWSNGTMTWGTPVVLESNSSNREIGIAVGNGKVWTAWARNSGNIMITSLSISGTAITVATPTDTSIAYSNELGIKLSYDISSNYLLLFNSNQSTGSWLFKVKPYYTTSSGGLTAGATSTIVTNGSIHHNEFDVVYDPDTSRTIVVYTDDSNSNYGTANVIQSSGTTGSPTVTIGSDVVFSGTDAVDGLTATYDTANDKVFVGYHNTTDGITKGIIGSVTGGGTNSISFAGEGTINDYTAVSSSYLDIVYDADVSKIFAVYRDDDHTSDGLTYKIITPGASSFTVSSASVITTNDNQLQSGAGAYGLNKGVVVASRDADNSSKLSISTLYYGTTSSTTINASQFVGTARSSTDLELAEAPTELVATANGSITKGDTVVLKSDGDVEKVQLNTDTISWSLGSVIDAQASITSTHVVVDYNTEQNKFVTFYEDRGASDYLYGNVLSNSGTTLTSGSKSSAGTSFNTNVISSIYIGDSKHLIFMRNDDNNYGVCVIATVSGTSITYGTPLTFQSSYINYRGSAYYDTDKSVAVFVGGESGSVYLKVWTFTVSGTTITQNSSSPFNSSLSNTDYYSASYDTDEKIGVIAYRNTSDDGYVRTISLTSSGDATFNTAVNYNSTTNVVHSNHGMTYDSVNKKTILTFGEVSNGYLYAIPLTVSGTGITAGTKSEVHNNDVGDRFSAQATTQGSIAITYTDTSYNKIAYKQGDASGSTITYSTPASSIATVTIYDESDLAFNPTDNVVVSAFRDAGDDDVGSVAFTPSGTVQATNLTATNFIGFAQQTVSDNEDVKVATTGQTDNNQSSLTPATQLYVQDTGTLSTTAGTPSVLGGTALSSTKILIKS